MVKQDGRSAHGVVVVFRVLKRHIEFTIARDSGRLQLQDQDRGSHP